MPLKFRDDGIGWDIDRTYETLRARGVEFVGPPTKMPWGGVLAQLKDPDGNVLTLAGNAR